MIKKGFTLIELLIIVAILSVTGGLVLTVFTSSLRGSNKSQIVSSIKQNGQSVLELMDKAIRGADNVVCVDTAGSTLVIVKDGSFTRYRFTAASGSSNGLIEQDMPVQPAPPASESDIKVFTDGVCTDPMVGANILTDTNTSSGVSLVHANNGTDLPFIVRYKVSGFKDGVTIRFALKPGIGAPQALAGQIDPVTFKTTIGLR